MQTTRSLSIGLVAALLVLGTATLAGCGSGGGGSGTRVAVSTGHSAAAASPMVIVERWLAYLADEATTGPGGTDLNANTTVSDSVATVVNMASKATRVLAVQADDVAMIRTAGNGTHLYTVTDEAEDLTDWNGGGLTDIVLLHSQLETATAPTFVATLTPLAPGVARVLLTVEDRLYFAADPAGLLADETSLMYVDTTLPTVPVRVGGAPAGLTLQPKPIASDEGLIFLTLDETVELRDINGDGDQADTEVLALLDGTDIAGAIVEVGFALQDDSSPVRALNVGVSDWLVGFLVDETEQLPLTLTGLNDKTLFAAPTWQPTQCFGFNDTDTSDEVLHYLQFSTFVAEGVINTGLVGSDRVLAVWDGGSNAYFATVSTEAAEGGCDLNSDSDALDEMLRWLDVALPVTAGALVVPYPSAVQILALEAVPGDHGGALEFGGRFINVISEADDGRDHDGDPLVDNDLIAWLDPFAGSPAWTFDHTSPPPPPFNVVGTGWMGGRPEGDVIPVAFPELFSASGGDLNGDGDALDSVPSWARFNYAGTELDFPGVPVAVAADNAGIELSAGLVFYRVDEAADDRDWNKDADKTDMVLFRTTAATGQYSFALSTLNNLPRPAIVRGDPANGEVGVAFLADETMETGADFNDDGDSLDLVPRWFRVN